MKEQRRNWKILRTAVVAVFCLALLSSAAYKKIPTRIAKMSDYSEKNNKLLSAEILEYDNNGNLTKKGEDKSYNQYFYDQSGRLSSIYVSVYGYTTTETFSYDSSGKIAGWTEDGGEKEEYEYGPDGKPVKAVRYRSGKIFSTTSFKYNTAGKLVKQDEIFSDGTSKHSSFEYDSKGRTSKTASKDTNGSQKDETYIYDAGGRLVRINTTLKSPFASNKVYTKFEYINGASKYDPADPLDPVNLY